MKRLISLAVAGILVLSVFAGCGTKGAENTKQETTAVQDKADTNKKTDSAQKDDSKKVTLRQMTWRVPDVNGAFDAFTQKYSADHKNVSIEVENVPTDQYTNMVKTKLFAGDPPDIVALHPTIPAEYTDLIKNDYLLDLSSEPFLSNVLPSAVERAKVNGKVYALGYDFASLVVLYNKKIFDDNGLKVPTNYQELLSVCETLKSKGITPFSYGIKDDYVVQFMPYQIVSSLVYAKNPNFDNDLLAGKAKLVDSGWKKTLEMTMDFVKKGYCTPNALGIGDQQSVELFAKGKAAMTASGNWAISTSRAANPDLKLGMFPFPANAPGEDLWMTTDVGQVMAIPKATKNIDEAKKYLAAWTDKDYAALWSKTSKNISTIKGVQSDFDEALVEFGNYAQKYKAMPYFPTSTWPAGTADILMKKFQEMYADSSKVKVDDILNEMDKHITEKLKNK